MSDLWGPPGLLPGEPRPGERFVAQLDAIVPGPDGAGPDVGSGPLFRTPPPDHGHPASQLGRGRAPSVVALSGRVAPARIVAVGAALSGRLVRRRGAAPGLSA